MTRPNPSEWLIRQRFSALGRALPAARKGDVHGIHQARVATRRLREALPLLVKGRAGRTVMKQVRRLTRALGPVRELDVALLTLNEVQEAGQVPDGGLARLRDVVGEERGRLLVAMGRQIHRTDLHKLEKKALDSVKAPANVLKRQRRDRRRLASADRRAARRGADVIASIDNAAGIYLPDRLHAVRIAVKKLRYAMEIARDLRKSRAAAHLKTLSRAQDLLGRMHDLEVLIARTRAVQSTATVRDLKLSADLDRLVRLLETDCRLLHSRYMNMRKGLRAICDHVAARAGQWDRASAA